MRRFLTRVGLGLVLGWGVLFLSSCTLDEAKVKVKKIFAVLTEEDEPQAVPSPSPSPNTEEYKSLLAKKSKVHGELLREIYEVALLKVPKDKANFGSWVDTLNQGASLEGVYRGLTRSSDYRELEKQNPAATPKALKVFARELAYFQTMLPQPTVFNSEDARPLPLPVQPGVQQKNNDVEVIEFDPVRKKAEREKKKLDPEKMSPEELEADLKTLAAKYEETFIGASIFTLKRVLGEEALKVVDLNADYPEKLALWYSKWVVHMSQYDVDYGLDLRNKPDKDFHYKWATEVSSDRVRWEVLNRCHRLLNEMNRRRS